MKKDWEGLYEDKDKLLNEKNFYRFTKAHERSKMLKMDHPLLLAKTNKKSEVQDWLKERICLIGNSLVFDSGDNTFQKNIDAYLSLLGNDKKERWDYIKNQRHRADNTFLHIVYPFKNKKEILYLNKQLGVQLEEVYKLKNKHDNSPLDCALANKNKDVQEWAKKEIYKIEHPSPSLSSVSGGDIDFV